MSIRFSASGIDTILHASIGPFFEAILATGWIGREREAVSLYTMGFLCTLSKQNTILHDPRQVGIEVAVPQMTLPKAKPQVCKDIVIWPEPAMVCWDRNGLPVNYPICIMEWKVNQKSVSARDIAWLQDYSTIKNEFVGYAIHLELATRGAHLAVDRLYMGTHTQRWIQR